MLRITQPAKGDYIAYVFKVFSIKKKKDLGINKPQTSVYFVACEQIHIDHSTEK